MMIRLKRYISVFLLLVLSTSLSDVYSQVNAEQVMNIGRNVLSMDDYMLSIQYFNQAIKAKPYLSEPYYYRALAKLQLDDYSGAEADCSLAIERNKFKTEAYKLRGFARLQLGLDSLAIEDYNKGLEYNPHDKYFLFYKSVAQTQAKRYEGADSTFQTLTRLYPRFEEGFAEYARMNMLRGDTAAALQHLNHTLDLSRSVENAWLMRADIYSQQKEWQKALDDLNEAIRLQPSSAQLYLNRAYLYYNLDNFFGAMSDYNYVLELEPRNVAATYNKALLLTQVRDYPNAIKAFTAILDLEPDNFHAIYNRALINLELAHYRDAEKDFRRILTRYPHFYPAFYGIAQTRKALGDLNGAMYALHDGEQLVKKYARNPKANPLDRPMIAPGTSHLSDNKDSDAPESEIDVMEKFNRLITVASTDAQSLSYNERIKGRVQDRDLQVAPEESFSLSFSPPEVTLHSRSYNFRQLDAFNNASYFSRKLYLRSGITSLSQEEAEPLFRRVAELEKKTSQSQGNAADFVELGVAYLMLKNYNGAEGGFSAALALMPDLVVARMGRAFAREMLAKYSVANQPGDEHEQKINKSAVYITGAMADYDEVLQQDAEIQFAWLNKGNIFYDCGDFTSALNAYNSAIKIDPDFGPAFYNRGLTYLQLGNKKAAFADLSQAGQLGVLPSYNLLKRMK